MRKGITNVFAEFYKDLYSKKNDEIKTTCDHPDDDIEDGEQDRHIPELTRKELMIAIDCLKKVESATARDQSRSPKELTKKQ